MSALGKSPYSRTSSDRPASRALFTTQAGRQVPSWTVLSPCVQGTGKAGGRGWVEAQEGGGSESNPIFSEIAYKTL